MPNYDALLIVSFGGPEGRQEVIPFLENVLRGRNVPRQRLLEVAEHYYHFDGISPINAQCRALIAAVEQEFSAHGIDLPIYWGNRNWHPLLADTLAQMRDAGVRTALAFVTSAYSSYSSCRQYLDDLERARIAIGRGAPELHKLRPFFNHPDFVEANIEHALAALSQVPRDRHATTHLVFTAHSIPESMAQVCDYQRQLQDVSELVGKRLGSFAQRLTFQSRSGPPTQAWLEPDIGDYLRVLRTAGTITDVVIVPIGFTSDHMEVIYDLGVEAQGICDELGLNMVRAKTAGTHPRFVRMIRELVLERTSDVPRRFLGALGARPDSCAADCCPSGRPTMPISDL